MFKPGRRRCVVPREQSTQTCRRNKLQTEMRRAFCNQARLEIVDVSTRWDHDQRRQWVLPSPRHNSFQPGSNRIVPGFPNVRSNEENWPRSFHTLHDPAKCALVTHTTRHAFAIESF